MHLTNKQKATLCSMAAKAYRIAGCPAGYPDPDAFRRALCTSTVGKDSLTQCTNDDFVPLYNALAQIIGCKSKERDDYYTHLLWRILDALKKYELPERYAQHLTADRLGIAPTTDLSTMLRMLGRPAAEQILYTINNRGRSRLKKENIRLGLPPDCCTEPHTSKSTMAPDRLATHLKQIYCPPPLTPAKRNRAPKSSPV